MSVDPQNFNSRQSPPHSRHFVGFQKSMRALQPFVCGCISACSASAIVHSGAVR